MKIRFLLLMLVGILTIGFISCKKDEIKPTNISNTNIVDTTTNTVDTTKYYVISTGGINSKTDINDSMFLVFVPKTIELLDTNAKHDTILSFVKDNSIRVTKKFNYITANGGSGIGSGRFIINNYNPNLYKLYIVVYGSMSNSYIQEDGYSFKDMVISGIIYVTHEKSDKMEQFIYHKDKNIYEAIGEAWIQNINYLMSSFRYNESKNNCTLIFDTGFDYRFEW